MCVSQRNIRWTLTNQDVAFAEDKLVFAFVVAVLTGRLHWHRKSIAVMRDPHEDESSWSAVW
jgi:hypothetical protein